ncbi:MAG: hypothetical protein HY717_10235 [Planctomycetes bacterium]|nr:hypothetical protein [Planctomycetota bacterium]
MLGILEKIQYIACGLILFLVLLRYVILGAPEIRSKDILPPIKVITPPAGVVATPPGQPAPPSTLSPEEAAENRRLLNLLVEKQGVALKDAKVLEHELRQVPTETYDYLKKPDNWIPELQKASSNLKPGREGKNTLLEIPQFEQDSLLNDLGVKPGDVLAAFNGQIVEFDPNQSYKYVQMFKDALKEIEAGKKVSVTVIRGGKPVNLEFKL